MIGGFKKSSRRNFRKKIVTEDGEEGEIQTESLTPIDSSTINVPSPKPIEKPIKNNDPSKRKGNKSSNAGRGLLSFEDDIQEGEAFQVRKSKESRLLAKRLEQEKKKKSKPEDDTNLNKDLSGPALPPVKVIGDMIVRGSPWGENENRSKSSTPQPKSPIILADLNEEEEDDPNDLPINYAGIIPDAATIFAAKKKRELARQTGGTADYIPINSTEKYEGRFQTNSKSRLIRDDDDSGSDEDRMELKGTIKNSFPALERRQNVARALEDTIKHSDEDEKKEDTEFKMWEEEQIRKGVGIPSVQDDPVVPTREAYYGNGMTFGYQGFTPGVTPGYAANDNGMGLPPNSLPSFYNLQGDTQQSVSADMVVQRLNERMQSVMQVNRTHLLEKDKAKNGRELSAKTISSLERDAEDLADRFKFYQETRGFLLDLVECFNEKVPQIAAVQSSIHSLYHNRCQTLIDRRRSDIKDQDAEMTGKSNIPVSTGQLDEFGRDRGAYEVTACQRRIAERKARQKRRTALRQKQAKDATDHHSGLSSDEEELDADRTKFKADMEKLSKEASEIFNDVVEDFTNVSTILSHFTQWKLAFGDAYKEAYISLCLPKLFKPLVQLEMLTWNPLTLSCGDFEDSKWFKSLLQYIDEDDDCEDDLKILPSMIEKVILPKLTELAEKAWDPVSSTSTKLLTFTIQRLVDDYPTVTTDSIQTKALFDVIYTKLKDSVENDIFIPLYPQSLLESKSSMAKAFLHRQYWSSFKLFSNVMLWNGLLSQNKLIELGLEGLVNRYLTVALRQLANEEDNLEKCKMIMNVFPKRWFDGSTKAPDSLGNFSQYLVSLAGAIYKSSLGYTKEERRKARVSIKKVISMLMHMHATDLARSVSAQYKIEVD